MLWLQVVLLLLNWPREALAVEQKSQAIRQKPTKKSVRTDEERPILYAFSSTCSLTGCLNSIIRGPKTPCTADEKEIASLKKGLRKMPLKAYGLIHQLAPSNVMANFEFACYGFFIDRKAKVSEIPREIKHLFLLRAFRTSTLDLLYLLDKDSEDLPKNSKGLPKNSEDLYKNLEGLSDGEILLFSLYFLMRQEPEHAASVVKLSIMKDERLKQTVLKALSKPEFPFEIVSQLERLKVPYDLILSTLIYKGSSPLRKFKFDRSSYANVGYSGHLWFFVSHLVDTDPNRIKGFRCLRAFHQARKVIYSVKKGERIDCDKVTKAFVEALPVLYSVIKNRVSVIGNGTFRKSDLSKIIGFIKMQNSYADLAFQALLKFSVENDDCFKESLGLFYESIFTGQTASHAKGAADS